jgi:hypothetical protein
VKINASKGKVPDPGGRECVNKEPDEIDKKGRRKRPPRPIFGLAKGGQVCFICIVGLILFLFTPRRQNRNPKSIFGYDAK